MESTVTLTLENYQRMKDRQLKIYNEIVEMKDMILTTIPKGMYMVIDLEGGKTVKNPLNPYLTDMKIPKITFKKKTKLFKELRSINKTLAERIDTLYREVKAPVTYKHLFFNIFRKVL